MNFRHAGLGHWTAKTPPGADGVVALLMNIDERKQEGKQHYIQIVELNEEVIDPAEWGKNFPRQYDGYKRTAENTSRRHGGSAGVQRPPPAALG